MPIQGQSVLVRVVRFIRIFTYPFTVFVENLGKLDAVVLHDKHIVEYILDLLGSNMIF